MSETVEAKHCYLSHTVGLRRWRVLSSLELHKAAATAIIPIAQTCEPRKKGIPRERAFVKGNYLIGRIEQEVTQL